MLLKSLTASHNKQYIKQFQEVAYQSSRVFWIFMTFGDFVFKFLQL